METDSTLQKSPDSHRIKREPVEEHGRTLYLHSSYTVTPEPKRRKSTSLDVTLVLREESHRVTLG